jgi:cell division septation protein DedD
VNGNRLARLSELERLVGGIVIVAAAAKPAHLLSDAEAVDAWRRLARLPIPPPPEPDDDERDQIVAMWRELNRR